MQSKTKNTFTCNLDNVAYYSKEQAKKEAGLIASRLKTKARIVEITANELAEAVTKGFCFTTATLSGAKAKDFISQQLVVIDIDNDIEDIPKITVNEAISILEANKIDHSFMYYSLSHTDTLPKFRIIIILNEPLTDPENAKRINLYAISLFSQADKKCCNLDRFYYPAQKLATEIFDRTTTITIPKEWQSKAETKKPTKPPINTDDKKITPQIITGNNFDLGEAIRTFDLLSYVEQTTGTQGIRKGKDVLINPCPLICCGHNDHFFIDTDKNLYFSHGSRDIGKEKGNILNYLMNTLNLDIKSAREYFIYEIMKIDRNSQQTAYRQEKEQEHTENELLNNIEKLNLSYLKADSAKKYTFYMIPKELIDNPAFDNIDYGSKLLYSLMLNRASFSATNKDFVDKKGNVFIIYTIAQVVEQLRCSRPSAIKMIQQLNDIGLIEKRRQGLGKPSILYVKDFSTVNTLQMQKSK